MLDTIIAALLPIVITLMLGFAAGWHHDFDAKQAAVLNRMVMLYALPLSLFAGMVGTPRDQVLAQGPLALAIRWFDAPEGEQAEIGRQMQEAAFADVPFIPLGLFTQNTAYRGNLTGMVKGAPVFWGLRRG